MQTLDSETFLPQTYKIKLKEESVVESLCEDPKLQIIQPFTAAYDLLPKFEYLVKTHHSRKRLQKFEHQLAGIY
ncbi:unnamed protein product, partial [Didymodactylos carnosus]